MVTLSKINNEKNDNNLSLHFVNIFKHLYIECGFPWNQNKSEQHGKLLVKTSHGHLLLVPGCVIQTFIYQIQPQKSLLPQLNTYRFISNEHENLLLYLCYGS